ncbi:MAG: hypothetical protein D4R93_05255 [Deltaproteobacteria bacterium]|nr:MAG: hypothetical protein D4R93_05255 [Deltaproteobacteria bacterium]
MKDGQILITKGYGYHDMSTCTSLIPDSTLFRIASISKLFTRTVVASLLYRA